MNSAALKHRLSETSAVGNIGRRKHRGPAKTTTVVDCIGDWLENKEPKRHLIEINARWRFWWWLSNMALHDLQATWTHSNPLPVKNNSSLEVFPFFHGCFFFPLWFWPLVWALLYPWHRTHHRRNNQTRRNIQVSSSGLELTQPTTCRPRLFFFVGL